MSKYAGFNEVPDGSRVIFTTPEAFVAGTIRVVVNGLHYASADALFGWTEDSTNQITFDFPPEADDELEAFYAPLVSTGTAFDPSGALP